MTTLIEDLTDLVSQYEMKKIDRKTLIKALKNIVKYEEKKQWNYKRALISGPWTMIRTTKEKIDTSMIT